MWCISEHNEKCYIKKMMERKEKTHFSPALSSWSIMHCDERERKAPGFVAGK